MDLANRSATVEKFLDDLQHPRTDEVQQLRLAILAAEPAITETVKWNAPNFRYAGEDRVTFRLRPRDQVQVVVHRGARVRDDKDTFRFDDPAGLVTWLTPDRGVISFATAAETATRVDSLTELVVRWVRT